MAKHERYAKHHKAGGHPLKTWIVERPFDSADYLDGPPPTYAAPTAPTTPTTDGGAVSAVTEAVQEGLRDAMASRERWAKWERDHGLSGSLGNTGFGERMAGLANTSAPGLVSQRRRQGLLEVRTAAARHHAGQPLSNEHKAALGYYHAAGGSTGLTTDEREFLGKFSDADKGISRMLKGDLPDPRSKTYHFGDTNDPHSRGAGAERAAAHAKAAAASSVPRDKPSVGSTVELKNGHTHRITSHSADGKVYSQRMIDGKPDGQAAPLNLQAIKRRKAQEADMGSVEQAVMDVLEGKTYSAKERRQATTMPDGGFPIDNGADLERAISAYGRAKNQAAAKAWIIRRAKALGLTGKLPDGWGVQEAADSMAKASSPEPFSSSTTSNWVARGGGLPAYIQHIAHDLMEKRGKSESNAIQMAIGIVKNWASGKGNVDSNTRAAAAKAVAEWEALKAKSKAKSVKEAAELAAWELSGDEPLIVAEAEAIVRDAARLLAIQEADSSKDDGDGDSGADPSGIKVKCAKCGTKMVPNKAGKCTKCGNDVSKALAFAKRLKGKTQEGEETASSPVELAIQEGLAES